MCFRVSLEPINDCILSETLLSSINVTVSRPNQIADGSGYIEFMKPEYSVEPDQTKARIRLRRRGSYGVLGVTIFFSLTLV